MSDIRVDGVETWVPLDLDAPAAEVARDLVDRFGDDDVTVTVAAGLGGIARRLGKDGPDDPPTLAAWVRTAVPDALAPLEVAVLRVHPFDGEAVAGFLEGYVGSEELIAPVETSRLRTASGLAHTARYRTVASARGDRKVREVHEHNLVVWLRPALRCAVALTTLSTDLVSAAGLPAALHRLAAGVHGL